MAFCEKCGAQIPENGTFCAACGAPVAAQAQPTRTPEQPAPQSKYAAFHSRQALKLDIVSTLLLIVSAVLAFTFIVPIAGAVCIAILFVVRIICFFQVCSGKAKDAAIIGKLPFLK